MLHRLLILIALFSLPFSMQAQLGNLMNKAKSKVKQRIDNKVDNAIDNTLDDVEGKGKNNTSKSAEATTSATSAGNEKAEAASVVSYTKFDFIPGDKVVYAEDFAQDEIGELPVGWNTNNRGEVITLSNMPGKWLRLVGGSKYLTANKDTFSRNFTIEFDLIYDIEPTGYVLPTVNFGFLASHTDPSNDNKFLTQPYLYQLTKIDLLIAPKGKKGYAESYRARLYSHLNRGQFFASELKSVDDLGNYAKKVSHVAMQVQGQRLRCWINDFKLYDLPMALPIQYVFNQLFFELESSNYKDNELGYYIGNIKVATGKPDTRHKFLEEGKFSTTGILFDFQSAVIKPESYGVIKEMATLLKDNGSVRVKVVGHTSSDGDDAANMELSKKRAEAVKAALIKEFSIDASRIEAAGKGETQPVADNKTSEGKMQNRRVEFVKL
jgi:OmpA-OmpF porin, OOP family